MVDNSSARAPLVRLTFVSQNREHAVALEWLMHCFRLSEFSESAHKASLLRFARPHLGSPVLTHTTA